MLSLVKGSLRMKLTLNKFNQYLKENAEEPKVGMLSDNLDEVVASYRKYATETGFGMSVSTSRKI